MVVGRREGEGVRKEDFGVGGGTEGSLCVWKTVGQKMQLHSISLYVSVLARKEPKTRLEMGEKIMRNEICCPDCNSYQVSKHQRQHK